MTVTERNHYLPQFYLRAFVSPHEPRVFWVYDKRAKVLKPQTPINTGIQRNFYNLENPDESIDDTLEREVFTPLETASKPVIDRLLAPKARLVEHDIEGLAGFLAFMATRVPRSMRAAQEMGEAMAVKYFLDLGKNPNHIKRILNALQEQGKIDKDITVEETQKMFERADRDFKFDMKEKVALMVSLMMSEDVHLQLLKMNWCLCRAPSNTNFLCGDSPLVCFALDDDGKAAFGGGYSLPTVEVTFPMSPNKCLYLARKHTQKYRAVGQDFVNEINRRTAWSAERFIISTYKTEQIKSLCEWVSGSAELPKIDKNDIMSDRNFLFRRGH